MLLTKKDYSGLRQALAATPLEPRMLWLKARLLSGGSAFLAFPYLVDLWNVGNVAPTDDPGKDLRVVGGMVMLYAYSRILIDGTKCEDVSATTHRTQQLFTQFAAVLAHLKKQSPETKTRLADLVVKLEAATAATRKDDDFLCRDGLAQMEAALAAGAKPKEVPTPKGQIGKSFEVPSPANYVPKFLPPEKYGPVQAQARASLRTRLLEIVK